MKNQNPYEPSLTCPTPERRIVPRMKRSAWMWAGYGFLVGAVLPIGLGAYSIWVDAAYEAALPVAERSRCGNGTLAAMMVIFFGPPIFGCIGALVGAALSRLPKIFGD